MTKQFSLYLDIVRFLAALFVVFTHYIQHGVVSPNFATFMPDFGREAVVMFFVLSGYVIAYTTQTKKQKLRQYFIARSARIYSVALPILMIAFIVAFISESYMGKPISQHYQLIKFYFYLPFHGLFLGELWNFSETPPWLGAYWSLGYEVWYYVFFATLYFFAGWKRVVFCVFVLAIMGHKLLLLLPVWLSGVLLFHLINRSLINVTFAKVCWFLSLLLLILYKYFDCELFYRAIGNNIWPFPSLKLGSADRYLADYIVCAIVVSNFYFAKHASFYRLINFSTFIKNISSYTFTLYLSHTLIISMFNYFNILTTQKIFDIVVISISIGLFTYIIGLITEHRKNQLAETISELYWLVEKFVARIFSKKSI